MAGRLVVVGGVAAGMSAAAKAKRVDPELEVVVLEKGAFVSYAACGMPYWLAGEIASYHELIQRTPEQMAGQGVQVRTGFQVTAIWPQTHTLTVYSLESGSELTLPYDRLVIATGARPAHPPLAGSSLPGVFGLRSLESGLAIQRYLQEQHPRRTVVVGGGYIGVEMAETFRRLGLEVVMLIRSGQVLRMAIDEDIRRLVEPEMTRNGVEIIRAVPLALEGGRCVSGILTDEGRFDCDLVLLGAGARPEVELAHAAGVALGATGAIATDSSMRTNLPDVYAAGDCAETLHLVTGRPAYIPLGSTANKQGRTAGSNAAGGNDTFGGVVGTTMVRAFDLAVARTGLTAAQARAEGWAVEETLIHTQDVARYFPGAEEVHVKLVADADSGRLLGGQIVGRPLAAKRIDVLAAALHHRLTIAELQRLDLGYAPPFSPAWDPILVAANVAAG